MVGSVPRSMADQDLTPEARPDEELTNAFNALFVDAYHLLEGGTQKVFFMSSLSRERQDLTTYDREPDFHLQFKPWILQAIVANDNGDMWPNLAPLKDSAEKLLNLHRSKCNHHFEGVPTVGLRGECFRCGADCEDLLHDLHTGQDCDHLDYSDTLDGATCNDCGASV